MATARMIDHQPSQPIIDWLADKFATHGVTAAIGALGGMVAALRSKQHERLSLFVKLALLGGIVAPFVGGLLREWAFSDEVRSTGMFLSGVFSQKILSLVGDVIDAVSHAIEKRIEREINPDE